VESKRQAYQLPEIDGEYLAEVMYNGAALTIRLTSAARVPGCINIVFDKVRAFRHYAEAHSTTFEIDDAFDVLTEVENSSWVAEIRDRTRSPWNTYWSLRHYLIYVDSAGAFEVVADSYRVVETV
jgi:hypothetical protein